MDITTTTLLERMPAWTKTLAPQSIWIMPGVLRVGAPPLVCNTTVDLLIIFFANKKQKCVDNAPLIKDKFRNFCDFELLSLCKLWGRGLTWAAINTLFSVTWAWLPLSELASYGGLVCKGWDGGWPGGLPDVRGGDRGCGRLIYSGLDCVNPLLAILPPPPLLLHVGKTPGF